MLRIYKPPFFFILFGGVMLGIVVMFLSFQPQGNDETTKNSQTTSVSLYPITQYKLLSEIKEVKKNEVDSIVEPYLGMSFWSIPLAKVQAELTRLDWVYQAEVKRVWPSTLLIQLQEQKPVVRWGRYGLLNSQGDIFYPKDISRFENLVQLKGADLRARELLTSLSALQNILDEAGLIVESMDEQADGVWHVVLNDHLVLWLDQQDWQYKMRRWLAAYPQVTKTTRSLAQQIDLRYSNGFVIKQNSIPVKGAS